MKRLLITATIFTVGLVFTGNGYAQQTAAKKPDKGKALDKSSTNLDKASPKKLDIKSNAKPAEKGLCNNENALNPAIKGDLKKVGKAPTTKKQVGTRKPNAAKGLCNNENKIQVEPANTRKAANAKPAGLTAQIDGIKAEKKTAGKKPPVRKTKKKNAKPRKRKKKNEN